MLTVLESLSSASSDHQREHEIPPVRPSPAILRPSDPPPVKSTPEARAQEDVDAVESLQGHSIFHKWLQRKSNKDHTSHEPNQRFGESHLPDDRRPLPDSPVRVDATNEIPSSMAVSALPRKMIGYGVTNIS